MVTNSILLFETDPLTSVERGQIITLICTVYNPYVTDGNSNNISIIDQYGNVFVSEWEHPNGNERWTINLLEDTTKNFPIENKIFTLKNMIWNPTSNSWEISTATCWISVVESSTTTTPTTTSTTSPTTTTTTTYTPSPPTTTTTTTPVVTTTTTTTPTSEVVAATIYTAAPRPLSLKNVYTMTANPSETTIGTDSSDSKGTLMTIYSTSLSFGPLAPGQVSPTKIVFLKVPSSIGINNIRLALIDCGGLTFGDTKFGVEIQSFIDYNIIPSGEFSGVNEIKDSNSIYNISVANNDLQSSKYVYLNVTIPREQTFGTGTIRYLWFFDYA